MHARTVTLAIRPDQIDAAGIMQQVADGLRDQEGFHELTFTADRASGQATIISLWQSAAARDAAETTHYREAMSRLAATLTTAPVRTHAEVLVHTHLGEH